MRFPHHFAIFAVVFFILSKILAFLISPINWVVFALLAGWFSRDRIRKRRAYIAAVVMFFVFTNGFVANQMMRLVELDTIGKHELTGTYDAGILLGGLIHFRSDSNQVNVNANGDRLFQTIDLYMSGKIEKIMVSSGSGMVQLQSFKEAYLIKKYLLSIGIPETDIWIETHSRNTFENAVETRKVLEKKYGEFADREFLLITSASHMRRAKGCFDKQGIPVLPYSTTKRSGRGPLVFSYEMILPDPYALVYWKTITHELAGLLVYRLTGKA